MLSTYIAKTRGILFSDNDIARIRGIDRVCYDWMVIRERGRYGECNGYREEAVVMDRKSTRDVQLLHRLQIMKA